MPTSAHQHISCSLNRGKTSQVRGEITLGENEFSLNLAIWKAVLSKRGWYHTSPTSVSVWGDSPGSTSIPYLQPRDGAWLTKLVNFGTDWVWGSWLTPTVFAQCISSTCLPSPGDASAARELIWGLCKASLRHWLQSCTFMDLRQPGITKLGSLEQKHLFWPGLEQLLFLPTEIPLLVCGAPPGEELGAFNSRLVETPWFLPLWSGGMQESSWLGIVLFETARRKEKGTVGKVHVEYPGRCWECVAHASGEWTQTFLISHVGWSSRVRLNIWLLNPSSSVGSGWLCAGLNELSLLPTI